MNGGKCRSAAVPHAVPHYSTVQYSTVRTTPDTKLHTLFTKKYDFNESRPAEKASPKFSVSKNKQLHWAGDP